MNSTCILHSCLITWNKSFWTVCARHLVVDTEWIWAAFFPTQSRSLVLRRRFIHTVKSYKSTMFVDFSCVYVGFYFIFACTKTVQKSYTYGKPEVKYKWEEDFTREKKTPNSFKKKNSEHTKRKHFPCACTGFFLLLFYLARSLFRFRLRAS